MKLFLKGGGMRTIVLSVNKKRVEIEELWSEEKIQTRVRELATEIAYYYKNKLGWKEGEPMVVMPILDGALFFGADLFRQLGKLFPAGTLDLETYAVTRYPNGYPIPGSVRIDKEPKRPITGKHLLVVEDIVFSGDTLDELRRRLEIANPKTLIFCVLVDKKGGRKREVKIDYIGFELKDPWWLVGYGLDFNKKGRELPWIGRIVNLEKS